MTKFFKLFTVFFLLSLISFSQISKIHYIPPLTANDLQQGGGGSIPYDQHLYLSTPSTSDVTVKITILSTGQEITYTDLRNDNPKVYQLTTDNPNQDQAMNGVLFVDKDGTGADTLNSGLVIDADCPVYASIRYNAGAQAGALVSKGDASLGTHFRTGMMTNGNQSEENQIQNSTNSHNLNFISVMATQDNTTVRFDLPNASSNLQIANYNYNGNPIVKTLNRNESMIIAADAREPNNSGENRFALVGALVRSIDNSGTLIVEDPTKPIVVNVGSASGTFMSGEGGHDHGVDQIVGLDRVGHEYIFVKGNGDGGDLETPLIIGTLDGTQIYINDNTNPITTIDQGDYYLIPPQYYTTLGSTTTSQGSTMYVRTQDKNYPIYAYQGVGGAGDSSANQGMFFVPPLSEEANDDVNNIPSIDYIGGTRYNGQSGVSIVTNSSANITITDGNGAYDVATLTPVTVTGRPEYKAYSIEDLVGNVNVTSTGELYLAYFNTSGAATSGGFYAGFASPPRTEIDLGINSLGNCLQINDDGIVTGSNITLQITNSEGFDSWIWEISKDEGQTWNAASGASTDVETYTPTEPGDYRLSGIISCLDNFNQYSGIIPVSICPSDSDSDGIIDNIDLDLDNDGIYNYTESSGNLTVDFSQINNPTFLDEDGNSVNISTQITTDGVNGSSTISGANNGDINFSLAASSSATMSYEIKNTSESLNYKFTGKSETVTAGDYFEIRVFPNTKNITLLDPNDELIIDSNFDGQTFDEGKTIVTGSVIRFKYKQDTADPTFEFLAYDIDGLKITSGADGTTSVSEFAGKIEILDYKINSDENSANSDSIYDYYDLESDGDECFDLTEAGWTYENFIGDPDNDGILGISPLNTNTAGVIDDRGLVIVHKDAGGYEIEPKKDSNGNYLFQTPGEPVGIQSQPQSTNGCVGSSAEFEVSASSQTTISYQWQFFNTDNNDWENLSDDSSFSGTTTSKLLILNISTSMDGRYRVLVSDEEYLCDVGSDPNVNLTVNLAPDDPIVNQIQTFCQTDTPTIANLVASNDSASLTLYWYESEDATTPLDSSVELNHNTTYYAEFIDEEGCVSVTRTPSKAFLSNPILSASNEVICSGEGVTLTIDNVAKTASDFASENDLIFITNNGVPVTYPTQYGNTYFLIQSVTGQTGNTPIGWNAAKNLTDSFNTGDSYSSARMYVILNAEMEKAVHDGLDSMGLTGNDDIFFWLGLYQDVNDPEYAEPGNASQNWGGWKWVDGTKLKDSYRNFFGQDNDPPTEPNDCCDNNTDGEENYGQFEYANNGLAWNDIPIDDEGGNSWPLFEYSGSSEIVWGFYNADGSEEIISGVTTSSYEVENLSETRTYFVKVTTNGVECVTEKTITVNPNPTAEVIPDYEFCDNTEDNDGNNGSITLLKEDFDALIPSILGTDQAKSDYTVTFYSSADDAATAENNITFPYTNPTKPSTDPHWYVNNTEIFVRVENNTTACFNADTKFNLVVKPKPIFYEVNDIILCDDDRDGRVGGFDLTLRSDNLRSGDETTDPNDEDNQSPSDFTITYHRTLADANNLESSGIENPDNFTIEQDNSQTIYFRIIKTSGSNPGCFVTGEAFDLVVEPLPVANDVTISRQCDGDAGDESQDGLYPFDTSNIQTTLVAGQTNVTTYYYYKDADNNDVLIGNELPNPFISGSQIITIQVENNTPQKCYDETTLEFIVDDSPETYAVVIDRQCDDGPSDIDGYSEFDTSTITQTLLTNPETNQTQSLDLYSVEYEYIDVNGNTVTSAELPNPFNTKTQTVKATVTNKLNGACVISENIQFTVDPLPVVVNNLVTIKQCDDGEGAENDGITLHDLTESQLLISNNYENETFEYYEDVDLTNKIDNPEAFYNDPLYDEIWVKIISQDGCERISKTQNGDDRLKIEITVGASQISPTFMDDENTFYTVCDDSPAINQDGISIFSSNVIKEINDKLIASREIFQQQNIRVTLHTEKDDANTGNNPIDLSQNFTNITPSTQEIWARIINIDVSEGDLQCLGFAQVAELYVEPRPVAFPVTIERQCDGDSDLDTDSQDGIYPFDTTNIIPTLLTNPDTSVIQDESILTITYFNEDGTEIPAASFSPTFSTASQTITIRVERDPSYPDITNPDGLCYDETTLEFIVDDTPELYPVVFAPHCDGDDGNDDRDGFDQFDTSTLTADLIGPDQSLDDYEISYLYTDEDDNLLSAPELRNPFNTKTQTVTVTLINKINPTCPATYDIEFVVNPLPEFTVDDTTIVCLNLPPIPIGVSSAEAEYTYTWTHTDLSGNNSPFPSTEDTIFIGVGGTYYVTATTTDGTNCSRTLSIEVEESEIATVTLDDITVQDLTSDNNNTITIDTANLGLGDYEFAIDDPNGPYQNDPFFENVRPGIHTIYIRDRNDCGIAQIDVSVIGYKKFFTPNGDGIHDNWKILGIRVDFQPNSRVYIFDRYGKLIKELDPVTEGWDGTYLGRPMPQTDYWFRVFLEDGREFKGHFSLVRGRNGGNN